MYNKRAQQIGETITWVVATVIILIVVVVTVFVASFLGHSKIFPTISQFDLFADKSLTAFLLTKDVNGNPVYNEISTDGQLNSFNGNLAQQIFINLYSGFYHARLYLGVLGQDNDYFNSGTISHKIFEPGYVFYSIDAGNNKFVQFTALPWQG
jgi:hypothetical protein